MAAPLKRVCSRIAVRQTIIPSPQRHAFTTTSASLARPSTTSSDSNSNNAFLTPFPSATSDSTLDPTFETDDLSSLAHAELAHHRELRQHLRLAAWEMPLLAQLATPYTKPDAAKYPLRWRYTTYMGELHPASNKVVVEFYPANLPDLTRQQVQTLKKLAGVRYDPVKKIIKMSCDSFEMQAANKRYLGDVIQTLITEAKDPNADHFADIPLDTRHAKPRRKLRFPSEWLLTEERKASLDEQRRIAQEAEIAQIEAGGLVSGEAAIEAARLLEASKPAEPVMVEAARPAAKGRAGGRDGGQQRRSQR